jgi:hypothetical protein
LLAGVSVDATKDKIIATEYKGLEIFNPIANGEFSLKCNKKAIVPETSNAVSKLPHYHQVPIGYIIANPRLVEDDLLVEMTIEQHNGCCSKHPVAGLHSTITTPKNFHHCNWVVWPDPVRISLFSKIISAKRIKNDLTLILLRLILFTRKLLEKIRTLQQLMGY